MASMRALRPGSRCARSRSSWRLRSICSKTIAGRRPDFASSASSHHGQLCGAGPTPAAAGVYLETEEVERRLREAGILVRSMAGKPLIGGSLRVSLGTTAQMQQFWGAYTAITSP